jgi:VanZ family protein
MLLARALAWTLLLTIVCLSLSPAPMRPQSGFSIGLEHFGFFALAAFMFSLGHGWPLTYCLTSLIVFNGLVEWAQMLVPGRHARFSDFAVKSLGIVVGLAIGYLVRKRIRLG